MYLNPTNLNLMKNYLIIKSTNHHCNVFYEILFTLICYLLIWFKIILDRKISLYLISVCTIISERVRYRFFDKVGNIFFKTKQNTKNQTNYICKYFVIFYFMFKITKNTNTPRSKCLIRRQNTNSLHNLVEKVISNN